MIPIGYAGGLPAGRWGLASLPQWSALPAWPGWHWRCGTILTCRTPRLRILHRLHHLLCVYAAIMQSLEPVPHPLPVGR